MAYGLCPAWNLFRENWKESQSWTWGCSHNRTRNVVAGAMSLCEILTTTRPNFCPHKKTPKRHGSAPASEQTLAAWLAPQVLPTRWETAPADRTWRHPVAMPWFPKWCPSGARENAEFVQLGLRFPKFLVLKPAIMAVVLYLGMISLLSRGINKTIPLPCLFAGATIPCLCEWSRTLLFCITYTYLLWPISS